VGGSAELGLLSGRRIHLRELWQYRTYDGLLEGLPTEVMNEGMLQHLLARYRDQPYPGAPYLIRPTERRIETSQGGPYPFGNPSALPGVTCISRFESREPAPDQPLSGLVVIWFQQEFALPIDPAVVTQIETIDWQEHAAHFDWDEVGGHRL
jgi:hypothetical protein